MDLKFESIWWVVVRYLHLFSAESRLCCPVKSNSKFIWVDQCNLLIPRVKQLSLFGFQIWSKLGLEALLLLQLWNSKLNNCSIERLKVNAKVHVRRNSRFVWIWTYHWTQCKLLLQRYCKVYNINFTPQRFLVKEASRSSGFEFGNAKLL